MQTVVLGREDTVLVHRDVVGRVSWNSSQHLLLLIGRDLIEERFVVPLDVISLFTKHI